jgi:cytochrome c551/c552
MKAMMLVAAVAGPMAAGLGYAQSGAEVLKTKGCLNCHEIEKKKVGPAYKDVAAKYKDDKGAESMLVNKIKEGKTHTKIAASDAELTAAGAYVLSLKYTDGRLERVMLVPAGGESAGEDRRVRRPT